MKKYLRFTALIALVLVMAISMSSCAATLGLTLLAGIGVFESESASTSGGELDIVRYDEMYGSEYGYVSDSYVVRGSGDYSGEILVIPSYIEREGEIKTVEKIGECAFRGFYYKKVVISDGVNIVGREAFADCYELEEVDLGSVSMIGESAFAYSSMEVLVIPRSVERIERYAFSSNHDLEKIYIPADVEYIDYLAFCDDPEAMIMFEGTLSEWEELGRRCGWDTIHPEGIREISYEIDYDSESSNATSDKGLDMEGFFENIADFFEVVFQLIEEIFDGLGKLIDKIFSDASSGIAYARVEDVGYEDRYTSGYVVVGKGSCTDKEIVIAGTFEGEAVHMIGRWAFQGSDIEGLEIQSGVHCIAEGAFADCNYLRSVTLTNTISYIEDFAFANCYELEDITLPENTFYVGKGAFENDYALHTVTIPANIDYLDYFAFTHCENVHIYYEGTYEQWCKLAERSEWYYYSNIDNGETPLPGYVSEVVTNAYSSQYDDK